jgi:EthD domain
MNWKMIYLARRNPGLKPEQFPQAWREHSALGAQCTNVRAKVLSVAQCSRVLDAPALPGANLDYDGVNLLGIRDRAVSDDIWSDAETLAIMRPDEPRVFDRYVRDFTLLCSEQVLRDEPRTDSLLVGFVQRAAGASDAAWHAAREAAVGLPAAGRCVWNTVEAEPPPGYPYGAIVEWWYPTDEALRAALRPQGLPASLPTATLGAIAAQNSVFMHLRVTHRRN